MVDSRRIGFVGLNNIKENDYLNVVVHSLAHVPPLRNFFILEDLSSAPELAQRFSILVRKIWNPRAFKSHVSPHELLQEVSLRSNKRFSLTQQSDPVDFLSWFLNNLHLALGGSKTKPGSSIIQKVFQGKVKVESQQITAKADAGDRLRFEEAAEVKVDISRFLMLTLDLPAAPLFQDELDKNIIPQVRHLTNAAVLTAIPNVISCRSLSQPYYQSTTASDLRNTLLTGDDTASSTLFRHT